MNSANTSVKHPDWVHAARKLIGENARTRNEAVTLLHTRFPDLESLRLELRGEYRPYALDTLVALRPAGAVEALLEEIAQDNDGSITLALNALVNQENHQKILAQYARLLQTHLNEVSTPALIAMVDFFTHLRRPLSREICSALLSHARLEVQQAAALHLAVVDFPHRYEILRQHYKSLFPQVRTQALVTLYPEHKSEAEEICRQDQDAIVQSACGRLKFSKAKSKARPKAKTKAKRKGKK